MVIAISLGGLAIGFASLTSHLLSYRCVVLPMWPEKVVCPSIFNSIVRDLLMMVPNLVGLLMGIWIYGQQPTNRNKGRESRP